MHDKHNGITTNENDMNKLQLHTHKVQAKSTCKFGAHDKRLACLGALLEKAVPRGGLGMPRL